MSELGDGQGSSYPEEIDRNTGVERDKITWARAAVPNDLADAIIKLETELGINPAGAAANVAARLTSLEEFPNELKNLVTAEIQQLENIGAVTISNTQWGYLGDMTLGISVGNIPVFLVEPAADQEDLAINAEVTVVWGTEIFDVGGNFATPSFTAPTGGKYRFEVVLCLKNIDTAAAAYYLRFVASNRTLTTLFDFTKFSGDIAAGWPLHISAVLDMDAADTIYIVIRQSGGAAQTDIDKDYSWFSGSLVA